MKHMKEKEFLHLFKTFPFHIIFKTCKKFDLWVFRTILHFWTKKRWDLFIFAYFLSLRKRWFFFSISYFNVENWLKCPSAQNLPKECEGRNRGSSNRHDRLMTQIGPEKTHNGFLTCLYLGENSTFWKDRPARTLGKAMHTKLLSWENVPKRFFLPLLWWVFWTTLTEMGRANSKKIEDAVLDDDAY